MSLYNQHQQLQVQAGSQERGLGQEPAQLVANPQSAHEHSQTDFILGTQRLASHLYLFLGNL
jgi:hypothetical protein